jgi:hypothetical protein
LKDPEPECTTPLALSRNLNTGVTITLGFDEKRESKLSHSKTTFSTGPLGSPGTVSVRD